jgi:lysophospholipase L1-like esterase
MTRTTRTALLALAMAAPLAARAQVIDDMNEVRFAAPVNDKKEPRGRAELVDGKDGKAVRFLFDVNCQGAFFMKRVKADASWDAAAGFSFWVKGDGSDHLGGIEIIHADDFSKRYGVAFSIQGTEWKKIVVPWRDVIPETAVAPFLGGGAMKPSAFGNFWLGKWWYWRDYAAYGYTIDQIALEPKIDLPPDPVPPAGAPLAKTAAKLKAGQPVTIVTMGDSLTDFNHWANKETNWPTLLVKRIEQEAKSKVTLVNPAIGGTELKQNLILMPRWAETTKPDLVTVCFGYNDWSSGMRGPQFQEALAVAVDRIRRMTGAEALLITTCPALERWTEMAEMGQAARDAAKAKNAGLADIDKAFHAAGDADPAVRAKLYCNDKTHLGPEGHRVVADTVFEALRR